MHQLIRIFHYLGQRCTAGNGDFPAGSCGIWWPESSTWVITSSNKDPYDGLSVCSNTPLLTSGQNPYGDSFRIFKTVRNGERSIISIIGFFLFTFIWFFVNFTNFFHTHPPLMLLKP